MAFEEPVERHAQMVAMRTPPGRPVSVAAVYRHPMPSRLAVIAIDCHDSRTLSDFWCSALGWAVRDIDGPDIGIGPDDPDLPGIDLLTVPEAKTVKNRLHLDLRADETTTAADEVRRLLSLGARHVDVGQPADARWVTLVDPEGNEFCVLGVSRREVG